MCACPKFAQMQQACLHPCVNMNACAFCLDASTHPGKRRCRCFKLTHVPNGRHSAALSSSYSSCRMAAAQPPRGTSRCGAQPRDRHAVACVDGSSRAAATRYAELRSPAVQQGTAFSCREERRRRRCQLSW
eukprot:353893-Chlamydomonas_euryale.AAC.8